MSAGTTRKRGPQFVAGAVLGVVLGVTSVLAGQDSPASASVGSRQEHGRVTMRAFFAAYDSHDISGVLATLSPNYTYIDCDYARQRSVNFGGPQELRGLKHWLRGRFRDHDQLITNLDEMAFYDDARVAVTPYTRRSDSFTRLVRRGLVQASTVTKWRLNLAGTRIEFADLGDMCGLSAPPTPSAISPLGTRGTMT